MLAPSPTTPRKQPQPFHHRSRDKPAHVAPDAGNNSPRSLVAANLEALHLRTSAALNAEAPGVALSPDKRPLVPRSDADDDISSTYTLMNVDSDDDEPEGESGPDGHELVESPRKRRRFLECTEHVSRPLAVAKLDTDMDLETNSTPALSILDPNEPPHLSSSSSSPSSCSSEHGPGTAEAAADFSPYTDNSQWHPHAHAHGHSPPLSPSSPTKPSALKKTSPPAISKRKKSPPPPPASTNSHNRTNPNKTKSNCKSKSGKRTEQADAADDSDDSSDDGYGINGIGYRPTPAVSYARAQKRKQQVAEWRAREARDARERRNAERAAKRKGSSGSGVGEVGVGVGMGSEALVRRRVVRFAA